MKTYFLILIIPLFFIACSKETISGIFNLNEEENFKIGMENKSAESDVIFTINNVRDSRCPSDVVCIWQGEAEVEIQFFAPFQETIVLSTFDNLIDTVGNYSVELLDVSPYPVSTKKIKTKDYIVKLKIGLLEN
jgi:hypothetical protein